MIRLAIIRHGHTAWNRSGRIQGRSDIPLDTDATAALARRCLPEPWDTADLCASPLMRAQQTAALISGRTPRADDALIEMNWGAWEGMEGRNLRDDPASGFRDIENWGWDYRPPGGESPEDLRARLVPWAESLRQDTVAVCHIGVMRVLLAIAAGWDFSGPAPFRIKRDRLYIISPDPDGWRSEQDPVRLAERDA